MGVGRRMAMKLAGSAISICHSAPNLSRSSVKAGPGAALELGAGTFHGSPVRSVSTPNRAAFLSGAVSTLFLSAWLVALRSRHPTSIRLPTSTHVELLVRPDTLIIVEPPRINPRAAEPPYRQIANWLRGRIEAGDFRPEVDPLPSEKELVETFEVARETARRAVAVLRDEGLVRTVPQRGTYVIEHK